VIVQFPNNKRTISTFEIQIDWWETPRWTPIVKVQLLNAEKTAAKEGKSIFLCEKQEMIVLSRS
jgi:hypothetical protein